MASAHPESPGTTKRILPPVPEGPQGPPEAKGRGRAGGPSLREQGFCSSVYLSIMPGPCPGPGFVRTSEAQRGPRLAPTHQVVLV